MLAGVAKEFYVPWCPWGNDSTTYTLGTGGQFFMSVLIIYIHIILLYIKYICTYIYIHINTHMNRLVPEMSEMCEMLLQSIAI